MSSKLTRAAYELLIDEDLSWLNDQEPTLEREHIRKVLRASADHEYAASSVLTGQVRARVLREVADAHKYDDCSRWLRRLADEAEKGDQA